MTRGQLARVLVSELTRIAEDMAHAWTGGLYPLQARMCLASEFHQQKVRAYRRELFNFYASRPFQLSSVDKSFARFVAEVTDLHGFSATERAFINLICKETARDTGYKVWQSREELAENREYSAEYNARVTDEIQYTTSRKVRRRYH